MAWESHPASPLFHRGALLAAVQSSGLWADSKSFVDNPARGSADAVLAAYEEQCEAARSCGGGAGEAGLSRDALAAFLAHHFSAPGTELEACTPVDWKQEASWFSSLPGEACEFALALHGLWLSLCRRRAAAAAGSTSTLLPLPHACFIPGDRFRETYYWVRRCYAALRALSSHPPPQDTYWIVRGLLASELFSSAEGVVLNLLSLLERHGFVPNGARSYYLQRSQPPLLSHMVAAVHARTPGGCLPLLQLALPLLQVEWRFWTEGPHSLLVRSPGGGVHRLSRYFTDQTTPRPESWREDAATAAGLAPAAAAALYREIASAAESGWDFSTRWMGGEGLRTLRTTRILPADLNGWLLSLARHVALFARALGDAPTASLFEAHAEAQAAAIQAVLWDEAGAQWRDFVLDELPAAPDPSNPGGFEHSGRRSAALLASNWVPLWCGAVPPDSPLAQRCVASLSASGLIHPGGLATTDRESGEQWDFPNSWPPLVHMLAEASGRCGGQGPALASRLAACYLRSARRGWAAEGVMHEKYDARGCEGGRGGGGEYAPQVGFGWSNGVALAFMQEGLGVAEAWPESVV